MPEPRHRRGWKTPIRHGHAAGGRTSPTYRAWHSMINRCTNPRMRNYCDYGGRGVSVCARWRDFAAFLADMGERPAGLTLDRRDNDGDYEPGNCRWATTGEQARNKRSNTWWTVGGERRVLADWLSDHRCTVCPNAVLRRMRAGWSLDRALFTPAIPRAERGRMSRRGLRLAAIA